MRIANNVPALLTHINVRQNDRLMASSMNRLSTGLRINSAREDAAGMAIANKLSFQLVGLERASDNSTHGISLIQTAEGALNEVHAILQRMRELAVQAANDTNTHGDRMAIQREINDLTDEVTSLSQRSEFNTIKLLNGEAARVATNWVSIRDSITGAMQEAELTRLWANTLFVSENMPAGTLRYDVLSPAAPAQVTGRINDGAFWNTTASQDGTLSINGIPIQVREGDSIETVWERIVMASDYAGVVPTRVPGEPITFTSVRYGSHERVELAGNAQLWYQLFGVYMPPSSYAYVYENTTGEIIGGLVVPIPNPDFDPDDPISATNQPYTNTVYDPGVGFTPEILLNTSPDPPVSGVIMITVNGQPMPVHVTPGMTPQDILERIQDAGNILRNTAGEEGAHFWEVRVDDTTGEWSIVAGIRQGTTFTYSYADITITADNNELLEAIGITSATQSTITPAPSSERLPAASVGACVRIGNVNMVDRNGAPIAVFNNSVAWTTSGHRVNITSAHGRRVELNLFPNQQFSYTDAGGTISGNIPAGRIPGGTITVGDESITVPGGMSIDDLMDLLDNLPNINASIDTTADPPTWSIECDDGEPLQIGGSRAIWEALGITLEGYPDKSMELRIESFGGLRVQIGPNYNMNMDIQIPRINAETLGLVEYRGGERVRLLHYTTQDGSQRAINQTNDALERVSLVRSRLGAYQNRLEHTIRNLDNSALNTESARSRIQDTDMAREMTLLSKRQVMYQAGLAILGQANQRPQMILQLLQ